MADFIFNESDFRALFPAFSQPSLYPPIRLQTMWDSATNFISPVNYGYLNGDARQYALNLMTAHLTALNDMIAAGQTPGIVQGATIDKVTITLVPPPDKGQFAWWLNQTGYGQQLLVLLKSKVVGGFVIGGLPETVALRKVYGIS